MMNNQNNCTTLLTAESVSFIQGEITISQFSINSDLTVSFSNIMTDPSQDITYNRENDNFIFAMTGIYKISYIISGTASSDHGARTIIPIINSSGNGNYGSMVSTTGMSNFSLTGAFLLNVSNPNSTLSMVFSGDNNDIVNSGVISIFRVA